MTEAIDVLFLSFYADLDRWHNDSGPQVPSLARTKALLEALNSERWMKDEIDLVVDGKLLDFSRFLSIARYGSTKEYRRYDPFNITLLAGSYFSNLLHQAGYSVKVANVVDRLVLQELECKYEPRFVLLSTTLLFDAVESQLIPDAVSRIRSLWPNAIIVLGGLLLVSYRRNLTPNSFARLLIKYDADVFIVSPTGEQPLLQVLAYDSLDELRASPPIPNTYIRTKSGISSATSVPEVTQSMDQNYIRWSSLPQQEHLYHAVHTRTARSCAFSCAFCEYPVNQGPLTTIDLDTFDKELTELKLLGKVKSLVFTDDTFNVPLPRFKELLKILRRYEFEWYSFFRPQYTDRETAVLMKQSGCRAVFAGLESVDESVLKNMNKRARPEAYRRGLAELKSQDIAIHANFIVGFPGETAESAHKIVSFINDLALDFITVCTWVYIPSTPIGRQANTFSIDGFGVNWRHTTMDSDQAAALARAVVSEQNSAVHNAVRGEAWSEFLLYANGFSVSEVRLAISTFNTFVGRDVSMIEVESSPNFRTLQSILGKHELPLPSA